LSEKAARHLAEGGIGPDPEQENALAWKWDPLLRAHSPLPISEPVVQLICAQAAVPVPRHPGPDRDDAARAAASARAFRG